ncbi:MAG: penicillin-binding transpeptidase domain-containing protein [Lysobacterales bacterium]
MFIAFAPLDEPVIAVAVLVENGGGGSSVAAPIARAVIEQFLAGAG